MMTPENKEEIARALAMFICRDSAAKSVYLEVEVRRPADDPRPKFAQEWAAVSRALRINGYTPVDQAQKQIMKALWT